LAYLIAPEQVLDSMAKIRSVVDQHSPAIDQATLARFITEGFFLSHVKRMRKLYADRRDFFIEEFNKLLGQHFILQIPKAGLNFVAWLRREADFARVARVRAEIGIKPTPLSFYCIRAKLKPAFLFGFAAWTTAQIRESLLRLASALR
jgi:GntR family transcriptional regulator/MocR family aminotransferase